MDHREFLTAHRDTIARVEYELLFAERVLKLVSGLDFSCVHPQRELIDADGNRRLIDFTIEEGEFVRIALEVDGYEKTGEPMTRQQFRDWSEREQAIVARGWLTLRFANTLVRDHPQACAANVTRTLQFARSIATRISDAEEGWTGAERRLEALTEFTDAERRDFEALREQFWDEQRRAARAEQENSDMKTIALAFAGVAVGIAVAVALLVGGSDEQASARSGCDGALAWDSATDHVGKQATVTGPVVGARYAASTRSRPTYLNVGRDFPDEDRFVVVIFGDDRPNFRRPPEDTYEGKDVAVTGEVSEFRGVPQIVANHPNDIEIC